MDGRLFRPTTLLAMWAGLRRDPTVTQPGGKGVHMRTYQVSEGPEERALVWEGEPRCVAESMLALGVGIPVLEGRYPGRPHGGGGCVYPQATLA